MLRALSLALLLALVCMNRAGSAKPRAPRPDQKLIEILIRLTQTSDLDAARSELTELTKQQPRYAPGLFDLAVVAEAQRDWTEAERAFGLVTRLSKETRYVNKASRELSKLNEIRKREQAVGPMAVRYDEAIGRARTYFDAGFGREAGVEAASAVALDKRRWEAFAVIGSVRSALRDYDGAGQALHKAIELAPPRVVPGLEKAAAEVGKQAQYRLLVQSAGEELRVRKYAAAAHHFLTARQLFPEREMLAYSAATALYSAKRRSEARDLLTELIATGKDRAVVAKATDLMKRVDDALARASVK